MDPLSIEQKLCEVKFFNSIYVECDKMYRSKVCVQEFSYSVSGLDVSIYLNNPRTTVLYVKNRLQVAKYNESYTVFFKQLIQNNGLVVKVSAVSLATWVRFLTSAETLCSASAILRGTEPVSVLTRALFILLRFL